MDARDDVSTRRFPLPADEALRLELLRGYGLLDTASEPAFDDVAAVAAAICGTPVAAVSLVEAERQWFKAAVGAERCEVPREQSFCAHTIVEPASPLVVPDTRGDRRFADNPLVIGPPFIRFYAGVPLAAPEGPAVGTLCVMDTQPRRLTEQQVAMLEALGRQVVRLLEPRRQAAGLSEGFAEREALVASARLHEQRFRAAFEQAATGMALVDRKGTLVQVNEPLARLLGRTADAVVGQHCTAFTHPEDRAAERDMLMGLRDGGVQSLSREQRFVRADGTESAGLVTASAVRDPDGHPQWYVAQVEDVTPRRLADRALLQTESVLDAIVSADAAGTITAWNSGAEQLFGHTRDEALGRPLTMIVPPRYRPAHKRALSGSAQGVTPPLGGHSVEIEALRRDGTEVPVELTVARTRMQEAVAFTAVIRDITERRDAEQARRRQATFLELLQQVTEAANGARTVEDALRVALPRVRHLLGWPLAHAWSREPDGGLRSWGLWDVEDGHPAALLARVGGETRLAGTAPLREQAVATAAPAWAGDLGGPAGLASGCAVPVMVRDEVAGVLEFLCDQPVTTDPALSGVLAQVGRQVGRVIERDRAEQRLVHEALHDELTGLPNPRLLSDRTGAALQRHARGRRQVALLFADLDRFQLINDGLGHQAGQQLLVQISRRIRGVLRETDTLSRFGRDEFVVLSEDLGDPVEAVRLAERILRVFDQPFQLAGQEVFTGLSIGIALGAGDATTPEQLLHDASVALYRAKDEGRGRYAVYDTAVAEDADQRFRLEGDLRRALQRGEFQLRYQPTVRLEDGTIDGCEALLRWRSPVHGMVGPDRFLPLLEDSGLIEPVGAWVIGEACRQLARWHRHLGDVPLTMAVNLSPRQLRAPNLLGIVADALRDAGLPPERLRLEVTEGVFLTDSEASLAQLSELRGLGVGLALDDFGTGWSSLSYLRRLPVSVLKIDRALVTGIDGGGQDPAIVKAVLQMANAFGLDVVAEGVETERQHAYLRAHGCQHGQGFLFAPPMPAADLTPLLRQP